MKMIEAAFNDYREQVIPADAPDVQVAECRNAFFAGVGIMFHLIATIAHTDDSPETVSKEADILKSVQDEIDAHVDTVTKGRSTVQ